MLICWCLCGSFCTLESVLEQMEIVAARHDILPVVSEKLASTDTRFGTAAGWLRRVEELTGRKPLRTIAEAEPIGPKLRPDLTVVAPCTGNTLAKLRHGISDGAVTLAVKSHLRGGRPLLLGLCSNDVLGGNFENLAALSRQKQVFFLPLRQDDPVGKPFSCVSRLSRLPEAIDAAIAGTQLRPLFETPAG